ncbi:MAG: alpha/beta hydrolase [Myxococcota bacterium]
MQPRSIRLPGTHGLDLHALEWSREGTLLLFLHGFSNDAHVWDWVAPVVAPHYRVVALDQRGHGDSGGDPEGRYDHETMARDANAAIESLGVSRVVIVGHSLGGRVAMRFAGLFPEKLAGLVIVDSAPDLDARGTTRISLDVQQQDWSFASVADYERVLQRQYAATKPEILAKLAVHWTRKRDDGRYELRLDPGFMKARKGISAEDAKAWSEQEAKQLWAALAKLPCPALVVRGAASDVMSAEVADKMADEVIPNAKLETVARAGHSVMLDNPEAFEKVLTAFVLGE